MRLTVAICTYNRSRLLRQTLEGVARQSYPKGEYEVLVIDNNSTDDTAAVVASFAAVDPAPRYLLEPAQGLDHARNRGVREARGDIIVFADDDILVEADWLAQMSAPFGADTHVRIGAVGGEVIPVFPDGVPAWIAGWHRPLGYRTDAGPIPAHQSPMGANLAIPKAVFAELGPFNTTLDRQGDKLFSGGDEEMVRRIRAAGMEVWFAPKAKILHQMPQGRTTFRYARRHAFDSARSRVVDRVSRGHATGYLLSRLLANPPKALLFLIQAGLAALILRFGSAKKALVRSWRSCGYTYQAVRSLTGRI